MRVAIVHYHLKPGGVTRVIENAVAALGKNAQSVAISGVPYDGNALSQTRCVPALAYTPDPKKPDPSALVKAMKAAAIDALGGSPDVWHIHNHSLGKNNGFADSVAQLAQEGARILLQIHDFAEDGRPSNYRALIKHLSDRANLYPLSPNILYATLNHRDDGILAEAGIPNAQRTILANPVAVPSLNLNKSIQNLDTERLILYPTRAIRRKNLGELVLWSAIDPEERIFATTASPANAQHLPVHEAWGDFAQERELRLRLGLCDREGFDFEALMSGASALITTSIAEGFGLAFLEPWLFKKPLCGRDIPDITEDFKKHDIALDALYPALRVPLEIIGEHALKERLAHALKTFYSTYETPLTEDAMDAAWAAFAQDGHVDFGKLDEPLQERIIDAVLESPDLRQAIQPQLLSLPTQATIHDNEQHIRTHFSIEAYGKKLIACYEQLFNNPTQTSIEYIPPANVLEGFLKPSRFNLLRT